MNLTSEEKDYIRNNYSNMSVVKLRDSFNAKFNRDIKLSYFYNICHDLGLKHYKLHTYTKEEEDFIIENAKLMEGKELLDAFNKKFGCELSMETFYVHCSRKGISIGLTDGKYKKGSTPWEHGSMTRDEWYQLFLNSWDKMHHFEKGFEPFNKKPEGYERLDKSKNHSVGVRVKTKKGFKLKHVVEWEKHYGKVPENHIILFIDGNRTNCDISNLKLVNMRTFTRLQRNGWLNTGNEDFLNAAISYSELCNELKPKRE